MVGEIAATYTVGSTIEIKVTITAHHVGYFEFDFCENAGELSEKCFGEHHLLRDGCTCSCPGDASNSCNECNECRRFWKAPMQGELAQSVTAGYAGPVLPGEGNLVPYEYTMHYVLPAGVTTTRGVLRWHYMTTNSCTSGSSAPEEFWNCADVTVADADGNMGAEIHFDNTALRNLEVNNLMPQIESGALSGVSHACPVDSQGNLKGVGSADEYHCGAESTDGTYEFCKGASGSATTDVQCVGTSASSVQCLEECGDWWYQCANGAAFVKPVPVGTKCKSDSFVIEAVCTSGGASPTTSPPPSSTLAPTPPPSPQSAPTPAPVPSATTTPSAPTPAPSSQAPESQHCGSCQACMANNNVCYPGTTESWCDLYVQYTWCGQRRSAPHGSLRR